MKQTTRRNRQRQNTTRRQRQRKNNKRVKGGASNFQVTSENRDLFTRDLELFLKRVLEEPKLIQNREHGFMILNPYKDFLGSDKYHYFASKLDNFISELEQRTLGMA